jgi:Transmembrane protein 26
MPVIIHCRFCPSVFFYLCTVIPSVWFLELDLAERRSKFNVTQTFGLVPAAGSAAADSEEMLPVGSSSRSMIFHRYICS